MPWIICKQCGASDFDISDRTDPNDALCLPCFQAQEDREFFEQWGPMKTISLEEALPTILRTLNQLKDKEAGH